MLQLLNHNILCFPEGDYKLCRSLQQMLRRKAFNLKNPQILHKQHNFA